MIIVFGICCIEVAFSLPIPVIATWYNTNWTRYCRITVATSRTTVELGSPSWRSDMLKQPLVLYLMFHYRFDEEGFQWFANRMRMHVGLYIFFSPSWSPWSLWNGCVLGELNGEKVMASIYMIWVHHWALLEQVSGDLELTIRELDIYLVRSLCSRRFSQSARVSWRLCWFWSTKQAVWKTRTWYTNWGRRSRWKKIRWRFWIQSWETVKVSELEWIEDYD